LYEPATHTKFDGGTGGKVFKANRGVTAPPKSIHLDRKQKKRENTSLVTRRNVQTGAWTTGKKKFEKTAKGGRQGNIPCYNSPTTATQKPVFAGEMHEYGKWKRLTSANAGISCVQAKK